MVNARRVGLRLHIHSIPTLCNQLFSHLLVDFFQILHSCYGHIEDMHFNYLEVFEHFTKNLHVVNQDVLNRKYMYLIRVINSLTPREDPG
jgi:hypothetical protein